MGGDTQKKKEEPVPMEVDGTATAPANEATSAAKQSRPKRARTKAEKKVPEEITSRFHCNYCGRDLSSTIRVRCAECADYDSCLDCFSVGASLEPHQPDHSYRLIEVVHTPIYQQGWSADEEDKLLEGLEMYGVGNWEQVAKMVGTKTAYDTEHHFLKVYLNSSSAPLPDPTKLLSPEKQPSVDKGEDVDQKQLRVMHKHQREDAAGWMPKREDFVYEWDNEAEDILGDMEITDDDSKADRELKMQVLQIYNTKLDERKRRKDFVVERGLTDFKGHQAAEKKLSKEEKEIRDKLRVFARFFPGAELDKFVKGILEERHLRTQLDLYREGRALGATTVSACNRLVPQSKSKMRHSAVSSDGTHGGGLTGTGTVSAGSHSRRSRRPNGESVVEDSSNRGTDAQDLKLAASTPEIDLSLTPGAELLSRTELQLCSTLKISPHQYMIVKEVMIRESARVGQLRKKEAKAMVRLDPTKVFKIYDYVLACGWIRSGTSGGGGTNPSRSAPPPPSPAPNGTRA